MRESILRQLVICECGAAYHPLLDYHECKLHSITSENSEDEEPAVKDFEAWEKGEITL